MSERTTSRWLVVAAALLFSTGGAAIKTAELTSWQVAAFRSGVAALALLWAVPAARRGWSWRVAPVGAAYAGCLVMFVAANKLTAAANAIFLQSTAPLYLLLLGPLLLRERIRRSDLVFITAVAMGMACFFAGSETVVATAPDPSTGNRIAAVSGIAWAFTVAGLRWLGRHGGRADGSMASVVAGNALAFLVCLGPALPVARGGLKDAAVIAYLGIFQIGLAYVCLTRAVRHVTAFETSALLLIEPALNPVWTWIVHGERPSAWAACGAAIILIANLANAWWQNRGAGPGSKTAQPAG